MKDPEARALRSALIDLFAQPLDEPLADDVFNSAALRVFRHQFARNAVYAAYAERRDCTPTTVEHWSRIPAVPTAAFREVALVAGDAADVDAVFRTSGTTAGAEKRGTHYVPDLAMYHFALIPNFAACVLPDGAELPMLSLIPSAAELPDSSLSHMISVLMDRLAAEGSGYFASAAAGIDEERFGAALRHAEADGVPVCIVGTSFAFVHWLDAMADRGERVSLPPGSRLMDTGGYKGRSREVDASQMHRLYEEFLGIPADYCVNEYGMTELCSQFYDSALRDRHLGRAAPRRKRVPPWVRSRIVDPETLQPVDPGSPGLLQHFDLANVGSVMAIQTEDMGVLVEDGFRLLGRAPGAAPRGCSIAMDLLLEAVRSQRH